MLTHRRREALEFGDESKCDCCAGDRRDADGDEEPEEVSPLRGCLARHVRKLQILSHEQSEVRGRRCEPRCSISMCSGKLLEDALEEV